MIREPRGIGTSPVHIQILVELVAVHFCPKLVGIHVFHALQMVRFGRWGELAQVGGKATGGSGTDLVVVHARWVRSPHGIGQMGRWVLGITHGQVPPHRFFWGKFHLGWRRRRRRWRVMVVTPKGHHIAVILHVRREKRRLRLQDIQGRHLRGRKAIVLHVGTHGPELPEVVERRGLGMARVADATRGAVVHPEGVTARLREVVQKGVGLHPLDLLGLLLPPGAVLVVGVILQVLDPQPLCLLHKGALVASAEGFPRLA